MRPPEPAISASVKKRVRPRMCAPSAGTTAWFMMSRWNVWSAPSRPSAKMTPPVSTFISGPNGTGKRPESSSTVQTSAWRVTITSRPMRATGQTWRITAKTASMIQRVKRRDARRSRLSVPSPSTSKGGGAWRSVSAASACS